MHGSSATFETKPSYCRVARQSLPCSTAVRRFGFKRRAVAFRACYLSGLSRNGRAPDLKFCPGVREKAVKPSSFCSLPWPQLPFPSSHWLRMWTVKPMRSAQIMSKNNTCKHCGSAVLEESEALPSSGRIVKYFVILDRYSLFLQPIWMLIWKISSSTLRWSTFWWLVALLAALEREWFPAASELY